MRSRSPGPPWPPASRRCRPPRSQARNWICGCWSITASGWFARAWRSTARCSGICTICGPSSSCRAARCAQRSGTPGSRGGWPAPSRRCASGPRATSCAACASRTTRSRRSPARSPGSSSRSRRKCSPSQGSAAHRGQAHRRDRRRPALRHRGQGRRAAGVAPIPASSGNTRRQRLDRGGNRRPGRGPGQARASTERPSTPTTTATRRHPGHRPQRR